ncbi:MAG TPA: hypothetical protein VK651_00610 [Blastocatellia bacterium]|nr:hypothetical protein [Blastocatellia bacterium]
MLMTVISLAISLVSIQSFYLLNQSESGSNQTSQSSRVQQEKKEPTYPMVLNLPSTVTVEPIALPPGENAWAVQIVSRGGFTGSGRGDLTITSDGKLIWNGPDGSCSRKLPDETMNALTNLVLAVDAPPSSTERSPNMCADCYVTGIILQHRTGSGVRAFSAIWDDPSQAKVSGNMIAVYEALMAQKGCKLQ